MNDNRPPTSSPPPTLEYGHRSRLSAIGRHKKKLIFLAICLAIGVPLYRNWEPLKHRTLWIYWAKQAAAHQMPAQPFERVIIDPVRAKAVAAANSDYLMSGSVAIYAPLAYRRLVELDPRIPKAPGSILFADLVFMGTMPQPDGTPRLVIVTEDLLSDHGHPSILLFPLPRWTDPLPAATKANPFIGRGFIASPLNPIVNRKPSVALTGILDPTYRSHMTIIDEYPANSWRGETRSTTAPAAVRVQRTYLALLDDGRFLIRDAGGHTSVIGPFLQPPLPTLGKP